MASDGGIFAFGDAGFYGSMGGKPLNAPIVGMAATPDGGGYWLVASDGGIFNFGDARFFGSAGAIHLNRPIVGMAATPERQRATGWWRPTVASSATATPPSHGSMGGQPLNSPIVGMAADAATGGYWEVASDGGIFSFGAPFYGSTGSMHLNAAIVGMEANRDGSGYRFVASDGGIFSYNAPFFGSMGGQAAQQARRRHGGHLTPGDADAAPLGRRGRWRSWDGRAQKAGTPTARRTTWMSDGALPSYATGQGRR